MLGKIFKALAALVVTVALLLLAGNFFFPEKMALWAAAAERHAAHLERKEADVGGFHIVYLEGGQGATLLLIHGYGGDKDNWTRVSKYLTPHFHVVAPDLPGFGESSKPESAHYRIQDQVENVRAIVQTLGLNDVSLGGNSMGGNIAAAYAAKYPQDVRTLWLLDPAGVSTAEPSEFWKRIKAGEPNPLLARTPADFERIIEFVMAKPPYIPGSIKQVLARRAAANYELHSRIGKELLDEHWALEPLVKDLATPTQIVWGDQDRVLDMSGGKILAGLMAKSTLTIMPGVGHMPMLERPQETAASYLAFRESQ